MTKITPFISKPRGRQDPETERQFQELQRSMQQVADNYTFWAGEYQRDMCYEKGAIVSDPPWQMVANKDTCERPAPQPAGDPVITLPDDPGFVTEQHTGVVWSGMEYEILEAGWIEGLQVWVPEVTPDYNIQLRFYSYETNTGADIRYSQLPEIVFNPGEWTTVSLSSLIALPGRTIGVILDVLNSGGTTQLTGGWTRDTDSQNALPVPQAWNVDSQDATLRINITDLDSVDRTTELLGMVPGTTIQIVETLDATRSVTYRLQADPVLNVDAVVCDVLLTGIGPLGEPRAGEATTITADIPVPQPTSYASNAGPVEQYSWANVRGLERLDGVNQPDMDTKNFGARIQFQPAYISPDWDFMSYSGGTQQGGGGTGGGSGLAFTHDIRGNGTGIKNWARIGDLFMCWTMLTANNSATYTFPITYDVPPAVQVSTQHSTSNLREGQIRSTPTTTSSASVQVRSQSGGTASATIHFFVMGLYTGPDPT